MKKILLLCCVLFCHYNILLAEKVHKDYASLVKTQMGTKGQVGKNGLASGYTFLGATYPFGMMQLTPSYFSPHKGIVVNQISGAGCSHMGNFPVIPIQGELKQSPNDMEEFSPYTGVDCAEAGYMKLNYDEDIACEGTVSKRSGVLRFTFPEKNKVGTIIIGSGISSTFLTNSLVTITSPSSCEGYAEGGEFCGYQTDYRVYFVAEFNRPAVKTGTWMRENLKDGRQKIGGKNCGAYFSFDTDDDKQIEYMVAISYVSLENARENLKKDNQGRSFDEVLTDTHKEWNRRLGMIEVSEGTEDRIAQFYTHFYHTMIHPNVVSDANGEYMGGDFTVHRALPGKEFYSSFSAWDTYRTQCQLVAMLFPQESSEMMQSLVDFAKQSGGYGRWIFANIETGIMQGDPTPIIIANTYAFGGRDFDLKTAYEYMKKGATEIGLHAQNVEVRPGLVDYMKKGIGNASICLEYTSSDYAIGQFAKNAVGNEDDATYFINRSKNWKNLYDVSTNWLRSRNSEDGSWKNPDDDWREATKENYFWMVPYDLETLIDTIGGKKVAEQRLDSLFVELDATYEQHHFAAGNEPDFQVPWIYNWVGKSAKTSAIISRIFRESYSSSLSGLPGNDDGGAMGAWYVFASVGMYPMVPGVAGVSLNMPQFGNIKMHLPKGTLEILGGMDASYIKSMRLNGKKYSATWVDWKLLEKGGCISYKATTNPQIRWGMK